MPNTSTKPKAGEVNLPMPTWEFVTIIAALMSLNALAIDTMLPALGVIGQEYGLSRANDQQLVIYAYIFGFGAPQLIFGPFSDRFGRKGLLMACLAFYTLFGFSVMIVPSFTGLLTLRFCQGVVAAGIRVIAVSIVRDLLVGRAMAQVMSLVLTVFMIVPIIAPSLGQVILSVSSWEWTFGVLALAGIIMLFWVGFRLPETLHQDSVRPFNVRNFFGSYREVLSVRQTLGYMSASGVVFGALFAFIGASEQIFDDVFHQGERFAVFFAIIAGALAVANFLNSRLVGSLGMRRISHSVLILFIILNFINIYIMDTVGENLNYFLPLFALTFACFGMMGANFSALAMEPQGKNAGVASAAYGFATSTIASLFGWSVSSRFDGSIIPILHGFLGLGLLSLIIILITERGRLFETGRGKTRRSLFRRRSQ